MQVSQMDRYAAQQKWKNSELSLPPYQMKLCPFTSEKLFLEHVFRNSILLTRELPSPLYAYKLYIWINDALMVTSIRGGPKFTWGHRCHCSANHIAVMHIEGTQVHRRCKNTFLFTAFAIQKHRKWSYNGREKPSLQIKLADTFALEWSFSNKASYSSKKGGNRRNGKSHFLGIGIKLVVPFLTQKQKK